MPQAGKSERAFGVYSKGVLIAALEEGAGSVASPLSGMPARVHHHPYLRGKILVVDSHSDVAGILERSLDVKETLDALRQIGLEVRQTPREAIDWALGH